MSIRIAGLLPSVAFGYFLTVCLETPVLLLGLQRKYTLKQKIAAGFLLTACSYPFVCFLIPAMISPYTDRTLYLIVAETFAPVSECLVYWLWLGRWKSNFSDRRLWLDFAVIILANLVSFSMGELLKHAKIIEFVA